MKYFSNARYQESGHKTKTMFFSKLKNAIRDLGGQYTYETISSRFLEVMQYRISYATLRDNGIVFGSDGYAKLL